MFIYVLKLKQIQHVLNRIRTETSFVLHFFLLPSESMFCIYWEYFAGKSDILAIDPKLRRFD